MEKIRREYPDIAPSGPTYSRAVLADNMLFISGCTARGTDAQGKPLMEQLGVTLDRVTRVVSAEGGTAPDIVKITTFVTSIADWQAHPAEQQEIFHSFFGEEYPANSLIEINALAESGLDVEIEAIAIIG